MKNNIDETESNLDAPETAPLDPPLTENDIAALKNQAAQAARLQDQLLRVSADLENYKKRAAREKQEAIKFAQESLLQRLIPVLDSFDMAQAAAQDTQNVSQQSLLTGIAMVNQQLKAALQEAGLEEIDATQKAFDPNQHEALSQEESAEIPEGHVVRQLRKGYRLRDRLLRPASVIVARPPAQ